MHIDKTNARHWINDYWVPKALVNLTHMNSPRTRTSTQCFVDTIDLLAVACSRFNLHMFPNRMIGANANGPRPLLVQTRGGTLVIKPIVQIIAGLMLIGLTGCVALVAPVPASGNKVAFGNRIQPSDLAFVRFGETTRREFESKIGVPWTNYSDLAVSVYFWEMVTGYWVWGGISPLGGGVDKAEITRMDVMFVEFTEDDRVKRFQTMPHPKKMRTKDIVVGWLQSQ